MLDAVAYLRINNAPVMAKLHGCVVITDWWTELMRRDAYEDGADLRTIEDLWPRRYALTPPVLPVGEML